MIIGDELRQWLADPDRQADGLARAEAFAGRLRDSSSVQALRAGVEARPDDVDVVMVAARSFLERSDELGPIVADMIGQAAADPFFRPPLRTASSDIRSGLVLFDHPSLSVLLAVTPVDALAAKKSGRKGRASIAFSGQRSVFKFVRSGGAILSIWECDPIGVDFTEGRSGRCRMVERRPIFDGETLEMNGRCRSFAIEHATADIVYLQAVTALDAAPLSVEYDSETLAFAGASSADETSSRSQMMLSLLRLLDRTDAVPLFLEAARSPIFHARWHAMRELLALDAEAALPALREMAESDPHPEVQAAASATLNAFFPEECTERDGAAPCPA